MSHTLGPWELREQAPEAPEARDEFEVWGDDKLIASLWYTEALHYVPHAVVGVETAQANGRLLAAAPDLLDALEGLRLWVDGFCASLGYDLDTVAQSASVAAADIAIRKAHGEA